MKNLSQLNEADIVDLLLIDPNIFGSSGLSQLIKNNLGISYPHCWIYSKMQITKKLPELDIVAGNIINNFIQDNNIINIEIKIIKPKIEDNKKPVIDINDLDQKLEKLQKQTNIRINYGFNKIAILFFVIIDTDKIKQDDSTIYPIFYYSEIISNAMYQLKNILENKVKNINDPFGYYILSWNQLPGRSPLQSGSLPAPIIIKEAREITFNEKSPFKKNIIEKIVKESKKCTIDKPLPLILNINDSLYLRINELKFYNSQLTVINPLLDVINMDFCLQLDYYLIKYDTNYVFYINGKNKIFNLLRNFSIGRVEKLIDAFDVYNELYNFYILSKKIKIEPIATKSIKTPDFKCTTQNGQDFFIELKSLGFSEGNLNYNKTIEEGYKCKIDLEKQLKTGKKIAFSAMSVSPLKKENYKSHSIKYNIETIIDKINNNIKHGQFNNEYNSLLIDLRLIPITEWKYNSLPFYQENRYKSIVSGILWNVAFGKMDDNIFMPIEFEGKENIEGRLSRNGILIDYDDIQTLCFNIYGLGNISENYFTGFYRSNNDKPEMIENMLNSFCNFYNDDINSNAWKILQS